MENQSEETKKRYEWLIEFYKFNETMVLELKKLKKEGWKA